jgi:hypothetical protein
MPASKPTSATTAGGNNDNPARCSDEANQQVTVDANQMNEPTPINA